MYYCTLIIHEYIEHHCHIIIIKDVRDMLITFNNDNNNNKNNNSNNNNSEFKSHQKPSHSFSKTNFWERLFSVLFQTHIYSRTFLKEHQICLLQISD